MEPVDTQTPQRVFEMAEINVQMEAQLSRLQVKSRYRWRRGL